MTAPTGLALDTTSHTPEGGFRVLFEEKRYLLDTRKVRLRRMRKNLIWVGTALERQVRLDKGRRWRPGFVLLTYRDVDAWEPKHLSLFENKVRNWLARRSHPYLAEWVAELQPSGRPHFHLVVWLRDGLKLPKPDLSGMWPHGWSGIGWARSPVGYLVKYTTKFSSKHGLPKGLRMFGYAGLSRSKRTEFRLFRAPAWLRRLVPEDADVRKTRDGRWAWESVGVCYRSPWKFLEVMSGGFVALKWRGVVRSYLDPSVERENGYVWG